MAHTHTHSDTHGTHTHMAHTHTVTHTRHTHTVTHTRHTHGTHTHWHTCTRHTHSDTHMAYTHSDTHTAHTHSDTHGTHTHTHTRTHTGSEKMSPRFNYTFRKSSCTWLWSTWAMQFTLHTCCCLALECVLVSVILYSSCMSLITLFSGRIDNNKNKVAVMSEGWDSICL